MKKWTIVVVVALMGLLLVFQYLNDKNAGPGKPPPGGQPASGEAQGVSLPPEVSDPAQNLATMPSSSAMSADVTLDMEGAKTACEGGSIRDILAAQGKTWGSKADHGISAVLTRADEEKMAVWVDKFVLCKALANRDPEVCSYSTASSAYRKYSPKAVCLSAVNDIASMAYLAGMNNQISACEWLLKDAIEDFPNSGIKNISTADFCAAAAKGPEGICAALPALNARDCPRMFPAKASDCSGDRDCLENLELYKGVKAGDPSKCGSENVEFCKGYFGKGPSCADFAGEASKLYCDALAKAKTTSLQALKERKAEEQRLKEERAQKDKLIEEINKRIREDKTKKK